MSNHLASPVPVTPARAFRVGQVAGVPVFLSHSWIWGLLLVGVLYVTQMSQAYRGWSAVAMGATFVAILVVSVALHEAAHAFAVKRAGYRVIWIMLTLWGGETSYSSYRPGPGKVALISLAGPALNALLGGLGVALSFAGPNTWWGQTGVMLAWVNFGLAFFNALPGLPMDGGQAVAALGWWVSGSRSTGIMVGAWAGRALAVLVTLVGSFALLGPSPMSGVWLLLIGMFLFVATTRTMRGAQYRQRLESIRVCDVSQPAVVVPSSATLGQAYEWAPRPDQTIILSEPDARLRGIVLAQPVDGSQWGQPATDFAQPTASAPFDAHPYEPALEILIAMAAEGIETLPVRYPHGEPVVVSLEKFARIAESLASRPA